MFNVRSTLLTALAVLPALVAGQAQADKCQSPKLVVKNDKSVTIKVLKIQYYDGCDRVWRTEDVPDREIAAGSSTTYTDDLEYVGNCSISKFKLYRATRNSTGSAYGAAAWGGELVPDGGSKVCNTNVTYTIHAHD